MRRRTAVLAGFLLLLPATACWLRVACPAHSQVTRRQDPGPHSTLLLKWHIAFRHARGHLRRACATVWLATFKTSSLELDVLNSSSSIFGTECVQGSGWAATIIEKGDSGSAEAQAVIRAIGGRNVSTSACF